MSESGTDLQAEDAKLVTLARGARGRIGAAQGAAVRDDMGRTYTGATVALPGLELTAMQLAVASAVAAGARGLEAVVLVGESGPDDADLAVVRALGPGAAVFAAAPDGSLRN